jgi:ribose transport system substrate-binding protein
MQMIKYALVSCGVLATLLTVSCASSPHEPTETYLLVAANTKISYWQAAAAGLSRAAGEMKVKSEVVGPDKYDPRDERVEFQAAVQRKPSGILVSAADAELLTSDINSALQQGIPVITIDSDAPASKRLLFIGTDNYNAGRLGGQLLVKLLGNKGNVVMFTYPNQLNLTERQNGYESILQNHPGITVTQAIDIRGDPTVAFDTAKQLLDSKAKVDAFVCLEAIACPEIGEIVNRMNMAGKITILAMDTDPRTISWIQQGVISATIAQRPYTMAYFGTKLLDDLHHHPPVSLTEDFKQRSFAPLPTFVDTGTFIVDKNNAAAYISEDQKQASAPQ